MIDLRQIDLPKIVKDSDGKEWVAIYQVNIEGEGELSKQTVIYIAVETHISSLPAPVYLIRVPLVQS